jgi:Ca2+-binding EF-hand superfamily protein
MGQKKSKHSSGPRLDEVTLRRITATTLFLPDEIQYFYYDFLKYTPTGYLTLADFERFYQSLFFAGHPESFASFVFDAFDVNRDGRVDFEEFINALYYTTKAKPADKIRWAFDLCDRGVTFENDFLILLFEDFLLFV